MSGGRARSLLVAGVLCATVITVAIVSASGGDSRRVSGRDSRRPLGVISAPNVVCDYVAAPGGRNRSPGTVRRPFRTIQRLAAALKPGETGCLRGGTYTENPDLFRGGQPGRPVTLRSYPGEQARLNGALWIRSSARYVTVRDMTLCGASGAGCSGKFSSGEASSVQVSGDHATFEHDDVSNADGICFILGTAPREGPRQGPGDHVTIENSEIHNCGSPGQSNLIEGIYDEYASGSVITGNDIYDNSAMGIQLYPAAQYTTFEYNVVWGNGEGVLFGGSDESSSNHNIVTHNVIGHSVVRWNIESNWEGSVGMGNVADDNCLYADNPRAADYYDQAGGVETPGAGAAGFTSLNENVGPVCASGLGVRLRP